MRCLYVLSEKFPGLIKREREEIIQSGCGIFPSRTSRSDFCRSTQKISPHSEEFIPPHCLRYRLILSGTCRSSNRRKAQEEIGAGTTERRKRPDAFTFYYLSPNLEPDSATPAPYDSANACLSSSVSCAAMLRIRRLMSFARLPLAKASSCSKR